MSGVVGASQKMRMVIAATVAVMTSAAIAQSTAPKDVIAERQKGLKDAGAAFKTIRDQMRGGDVAAIKTAAQTIEQTSTKMAAWFPKGSGPEAGVKTAAKPEIWTDAAGFEAAIKKYVEEAAKFNALAKTGDIAAIRGGVRALGESCGGCHDKFRVKED